MIMQTEVVVGPGLRARQREETRKSIQRAALELADEVGYRKVTVEAVSSRAGISPRTFFNHFPTKEAAIVREPPIALPEERLEALRHGPTVSPRDALVELTRALIAQIEADPPDRWTAERVARIAAQNPEVFAAMVGQIESLRRELAVAVAARLDSRDRQIADLVASMAMAAVRSGLESWAVDVGAPASRLGHHVRRAASFIESLSSSPGSPSA